MSFQGWQELVASTVADATAVTLTAEAILVPDFSLPANFMYPGRTLRATLTGIISNIVTTPGTISVWARWGGVGGVSLVASPAMSQNVTAQTNDSWKTEFIITCRSIGTSGTFLSSGVGFFGNAIAANVGQFVLFPATGNTASGACDTTVVKSLSFTAKFSLTGNSMTCQQYLLEALN